MADEVPQPLNYIPEVILKKRKNNEEWAIRRKLQLEQKVRKLKSDSFVIKKPEQFIREYRDKVLLFLRTPALYPQTDFWLTFLRKVGHVLSLAANNASRADEVPQTLSYIPEVILRKRKNNEWAIRLKLQLEQKVRKLKSDSFVIKKPEQFIREYGDKEMDLVQMKQRGKRTKGALIMPDSKLLFVIRIGGKSDMHPRTRKALYSLRLRKIFSGVFLKANERIMEILQKMEPYVTYGYPNLKSVNDLIYKKGAGKADNQRVPLTSNDIVEQTLGHYGIICIEDVVREIANVGPHFKEVTSFLCPFTLTRPERALQGKKRRYNDGGDSGNREDHINELISRMN